MKKGVEGLMLALALRYSKELRLLCAGFNREGEVTGGKGEEGRLGGAGAHWVFLPWTGDFLYICFVVPK